VAEPASTDAATLEVYARRHADWVERRPANPDEAIRFVMGLRADDRPVLDLGCGPGGHLPMLPPRVIGVDRVRALLNHARHNSPDTPLVEADLTRLPFATGSLGACWAARSYVHLPRSSVPLALWDLHRCLRPGAPIELRLFEGDQEYGPFANDDFPDRRFSLWPTDLLTAVLEGAGFEDVIISSVARRDPTLVVRARRAQTIADTVGPGMRLLCVGLNPSPLAAERGIGFVRPGNRFWPAAIQAGIVSVDRDPRHALVHHGIGMTDLVKRPTRTAAELTTGDYQHGMDRLRLLCDWLRPAAVCIVGLAGWRAAVDPHATAGWQQQRLGESPVYVMPNPSGLNAHATVESLAEHLAAAAA
jgi:TDG/mug DNA glycosylase family protein